MRGVRPADGQTVLTPGFLEAAAGKAAEDALLAVRVDTWDENRLLADRIVTFQFQSALVANDGELLWSGTRSGQVKAGGAGAAPVGGKDQMARSCAELALNELLVHLRERTP